MKTRKKIELLRGITAIRVKAGITQAALAQYLGISKSLVSMVENNHRSLPPAAMMKLSELELQFQQQQCNETILRQTTCTESPGEASIRSLKESIRRIDLERLKYRLNKTEQLREETLASLQYLYPMQKDAAGFTINILALEEKKLLKRLKRCDETAFATLRGKMKMLEIVLESYDTEDGTKVTTQSADNIPAIGQCQKAGKPVIPEITPGNPSDFLYTKLLRESTFYGFNWERGDFPGALVPSAPVRDSRNGKAVFREPRTTAKYLRDTVTSTKTHSLILHETFAIPIC